MIVSIDLYQFYCQTDQVIFKYMNINTISPDIDADNRLTINISTLLSALFLSLIDPFMT